jgi:DUF1680 family protein
MVPTWTYATAPDGIYVNLYIGSTVRLERAAGTEVEIVQDTDYPWSGKIALTVNPAEAKSFALRLRIPNRTTSKLYKPTPEVSGLVSLAVNGKPVKPVIEKGYAVIQRDWKAGDKVELELPLKVQRVEAVDEIEATKGKVALRYGPLVYNIEKVDQDITKPLAADASLAAEWRPDLLGGVTVITGKFADGSKLLAIPNYARINRQTDLPPEAGPISGRPELYMGPNAKLPERPEDGARRRLPPESIIWIERA